MGSRWYDPGLGRFMQPDSLGAGGGDVNLYRYANNQPMSSIDPTGLDDFPDSGDGSLQSAIDYAIQYDNPPEQIPLDAPTQSYPPMSSFGPQAQAVIQAEFQVTGGRFLTPGETPSNEQVQAVINEVLRQSNGNSQYALDLIAKGIRDRGLASDPLLADVDHYFQSAAVVAAFPWWGQSTALFISDLSNAGYSAIKFVVPHILPTDTNQAVSPVTWDQYRWGSRRWMGILHGVRQSPHRPVPRPQ